MNDETVEVWSSEAPEARRVGTLRPSFQGLRTLASSSFEYDPDFLRDGWQVSPDLPLRPGRTYTADNQTLPGAFSDAAPDEWGQKLIRADHALRRQHDASLPARLGEFDYLSASRTTPGSEPSVSVWAVRGRPQRRESRTCTNSIGSSQLPRGTKTTRRRRGHRLPRRRRDLTGGARPKANVVTADGTLAIAKLPHSKDGRFDVERWEAVALRLASDAGLRVPRWSLVPPGAGRAVLLSERFDRDPAGHRLGYMSARTALELGAHDDGTRLTYEDLSDVIDHWSTAPAEDLGRCSAG